MIASFADGGTAKLAENQRVRKLIPVERVALRKLRQLQAAGSLSDIAVPPGNRLELLKGERRGQWSMRVNDRFRLCFRWGEGQAYGVEIVGYHG